MSIDVDVARALSLTSGFEGVSTFDPYTVSIEGADHVVTQAGRRVEIEGPLASRAIVAIDRKFPGRYSLVIAETLW